MLLFPVQGLAPLKYAVKDALFATSLGELVCASNSFPNDFHSRL